MSKYPVHKMQDGVWYPSSDSDDATHSMVAGGIIYRIQRCRDGAFTGDAFGGGKCLVVLRGDERTQTFRKAEAVLLAAVEAADKPEWIDAKSGLAAMCEWRWWTLVVVSGFYFHARGGLGGVGYFDSFEPYETIDLAKSAAEAWVREQTGKGEST